MKPITFEGFVVGTWRSDCFDRCSPTTQRRVDSLLRTQLLPEFGRSKLDQITTENVIQWFDRYSTSAPAGANRTLDVLVQIFNYAITCEYLIDNPARGVRRNPRPTPTRFLTQVEVRRLHSALDRHRGRGSGAQQADIIRLLLLTGCRKGELIRLRWEEVGGDRIYLHEAKTGPRTVFLSMEAQAIISKQPRESEYVFPSRNNPSQCRSIELSLWRKVRRIANIEDVRLHDLRHTFASHAVMSGVPLPVISRLLGHAQVRMTLRYAHVSDLEAEAAAERVGSAIHSVIHQVE